ncbi:MAG: DUF3179 domain-containing protein, partial [Actinomycetota bacterium]
WRCSRIMWFPKGAFMIIAIGVLAAACSDASPTPSAGGSPPSETTGLAPPVDEQVQPPDVDTSLHSVPLDEIYFDTFDGGSITLADSTPEIREALLDAIPPIDDPTYGPPEQGDWLDPSDLVLGYEGTDSAYAYPFKILNFHEIVNEEIDGVPILVSYCPLCRSAIVYDRRLDGMELEFSNTSALHESDLVMVDRTTGSYWWQVAGSAIVGPLTGTSLETLPSTVATWSDWKRIHPDTVVLTRDTGFARPYASDSFSTYADYVASGQFAFPVSPASLDDRLPPATLVVAVTIGDTVRAYPVDDLAAPINDTVAGTPIVILPTDGGGGTFSPIVNGETLTFDRRRTDLVDTATGTTWTANGVGVDGELTGVSLVPIPSRTTFWFAIVGAFPRVEVFTAP